MELEKMSTTELKALAYDQIAELERVQNNLRVINAELSKRATKTATKPATLDEPTEE